MKLCERCGHWNMRPGTCCEECKKPLPVYGTVYEPTRGRDDRTPSHTPRQRRDDP